MVRRSNQLGWKGGSIPLIILGSIRFYRKSKLDSNSAPRARDGNRVNDFAAPGCNPLPVADMESDTWNPCTGVEVSIPPERRSRGAPWSA